MNMKIATALILGFSVGMSWAHPVPPELFEPGSAVLFQGDSITDGMHGGDMNHVYGHGYACEIASRYQAYRPEGRVQFGNRGKSGDTSSNLVERWSTDAFPYVIRENGYEGALGLKKGQFVTPDWVSILVGINDYFYWIRNLPQKVSCEDYERNLHKLIADAKSANPKVKIVLCEPFRIPTDASPEFCRRQDVVAKLAAEFDCAFVPFQKLFSEDLLKLNANPRYWFWDFFHPTPAGHMKMADFWIDSVDRRVRRTVRNTALEPRAKLEDDSYDWYARHERIVKEQAKIDPEIVFIGDSITHGWEANDNLRGDAAACFKKWFGKYRTLNMGFGWDRIQNVLWRLSHGEMDGTKPRVVVIHIGTNNMAPGCKRPFPANTSDEIAEGIVEVCRRVREKAPRAKIVLMDVFPRGGKDQGWRKDVAAINAALNPKVEALADGNLVRVNLWDKYVGPDGEIPKELMFDTLHPTVKGYDIWGEALRPFVDSAVEITAYRALSEVKDGTRVWDAALRRAMSEHTVVVFPKGDYQFAETILVGSNCRLEADADATIGHAPAFDGLLVRNVPGAKNVRISGGTWYDHPRDNLKYGDYRNTVGDNSQMFRFLWCDGVVFRDLVVSNAPTFSFQAGGVTNLLVENVRIIGGGADGIHLNGWIKNAVVRNVRGDTGDDIVALNAWDWPKSTECYGPSEDVTIDDVQGSYGAIRLLPGKVRKDAYSPWLDCAIRRVTIRNCCGLAAVKASFQGVHSPNHVMGSLSDIMFENLELDLTHSYTEPPAEAEKPGGRGHFAAFEFGSNAERVRFRNVTVNFHADKYPSGHFLLVGPWWWEKSISPVVKDVRIEGFAAKGTVPSEFCHETAFDPTVLGAEWSGRGRFENVNASVSLQQYSETIQENHERENSGQGPVGGL